jgi:uncharacterized protein YecE (DUF72 family)
MTDFLVGAGGWDYFQVPGLSSLEAYAKAFSFVELNSTFYQIPSLQLVKTWRQRVPLNFEFSVRCHKDITHKFQLEPFVETFKTFEIMMDICRILNSQFLVLVTPSTLDFNREKINGIRNCLESLDLKRIKIVWEVRLKRGESIPSSLISLIQEYDIIHCVDASRESINIDSNIVYTRIFGKGIHNIYQFSDEELLEINEKLSNKKSDMVVISFHNVKMYKDATRFKIYKQTNRFLPVTKTRGLQSLKEVLMEDAVFPASKHELIRDQGWKVIDMTDTRRIHANILLDKLSDKSFRNVEEVIKNLN